MCGEATQICVGRPHILFSYYEAIIKSFNILCGVWPHKIIQTTISRHFIFIFTILTQVKAKFVWGAHTYLCGQATHFNLQFKNTYIVMVKICVGRPHKFVWAGHTFYIQGIIFILFFNRKSSLISCHKWNPNHNTCNMT